MAAAASAGSWVGVAVCALGWWPGQCGQLRPQSRPFFLHNSHLPAPLGRPRPRPPLGPGGSGVRASPAASHVGVNGRSRYRGFQGRVPGGAYIFAPSVWSGTACQRKRLLVFVEAVHCSYLAVQKSARRRASFLGNHDPVWRSALPRRTLQARERERASEGPPRRPTKLRPRKFG